MTTETQQLVRGVEEQQAELTCRHYWVIDMPKGPVSKGICRLCGEERQFHNYLGSHPWEQDEGLSHKGGEARLDWN